MNWDRPPYWEFALTADLLRPRLAAACARVDPAGWEWLARDDRGGANMVFVGPVARRALWVCGRLADLVQRDLVAAWGPPGAPGDERAIRAACARIGDAMDELAAIEAEVARTPLVSFCRDFALAARGLTRDNAAVIGDVIDRIERLCTAGCTGAHRLDYRPCTSGVAAWVGPGPPGSIFASEREPKSGCQELWGVLFLIALLAVLVLVCPWWVLLLLFLLGKAGGGRT